MASRWPDSLVDETRAVDVPGYGAEWLTVLRCYTQVNAQWTRIVMCNFRDMAIFQLSSFMILPDTPAAAPPSDSDDRVLPAGDNRLAIGPGAELHHGAAGAGVGITRSGSAKCLGKKYTESSGQRSPGRAIC